MVDSKNNKTAIVMGVFFMSRKSKVNYEFKIKAVKDYLLNI